MADADSERKQKQKSLIDEIGSQWKQAIIYGVGMVIVGMVAFFTGRSYRGLYVPQGLLYSLPFILIGFAIIALALVGHFRLKQRTED
jgi:hypothetical protein